MISRERFEKYMSFRRDGSRPTSVVEHMRKLDQIDALGMKGRYDRNGFPNISWGEDGFEFYCRVSIDECADLTYLGEFTNEKTPGVIERKNVGRNEYRYYVPPENLNDERATLHKLGFSKHESYTLARKYQRDRMKRLEQAGTYWNPYNVDVIVWRFDIELASICVGVYEFTEGVTKLELCTVAFDLRGEARSAAEERLAELRSLICGKQDGVSP
jgi:hypothetical protein